MKVLVQQVQGGTGDCNSNKLPGEAGEVIVNLDCPWESQEAC